MGSIRQLILTVALLPSLTSSAAVAGGEPVIDAPRISARGDRLALPQRMRLFNTNGDCTAELVQIVRVGVEPDRPGDAIENGVPYLAGKSGGGEGVFVCAGKVQRRALDAELERGRFAPLRWRRAGKLTDRGRLAIHFDEKRFTVDRVDKALEIVVRVRGGNEIARKTVARPAESDLTPVAVLGVAIVGRYAYLQIEWHARVDGEKVGFEEQGWVAVPLRE